MSALQSRIWREENLKAINKALVENNRAPEGRNSALKVQKLTLKGTRGGKSFEMGNGG